MIANFALPGQLFTAFLNCFAFLPVPLPAIRAVCFSIDHAPTKELFTFRADCSLGNIFCRAGTAEGRDGRYGKKVAAKKAALREKNV